MMDQFMPAPYGWKVNHAKSNVAEKCVAGAISGENPTDQNNLSYTMKYPAMAPITIPDSLGVGEPCC